MSISATRASRLRPKNGEVAGQLVDAYLEQMAETGVVGATVRVVAARAGASASAVSYHFDSIERLYVTAQAEAVARAERWLDRTLDDVAPSAPLPASAFPVFAAQVIARWVDQSILSQAEACAMQDASWGGAEAGPWIELWNGFWRRTAAVFSIEPEASLIIAAVLQSERIGHLAKWRVLHDRAALYEVCERLIARLTGDATLLARPDVWRDKAEELSCRAVSFPELNAGAGRIAEAVVGAVDAGGEAALTHRAAAARAGVSLGAVTHHFPTRTALAEAGYAWLYGTIVALAGTSVPRKATHADMGLHIRSFLDVGLAAPGVRALEVFFLSATRDPSLADFAARVRYSRGLSTWEYLREAAPHLTRLDGVLMSHLVTGLGRMISVSPERAEEILDRSAPLAERMFRA